MVPEQSLSQNRYYSIGDFSRKAGVSTHFLKFYEEKGIFAPVVGENSYRYYGIWDASSVLECRWMKNVGFSVKEIEKNFRDNTPQELDLLLETQQSEMEQLLQLQQMHLMGLKKLREGLRFCKEEHWSVRVVPEQWFLPHTIDREFWEDERVYDQLPEWLKWMPMTLSAQSISLREDGSLQEEWGMGIETTDAEKIGFSPKAPARSLRFGQVLEYYHSSKTIIDGTEERFLYEKFQQKARQLNLIPEPLVYRKLFCYTKKDGVNWEHCVYQVPVRLPEE